MVKDATVRSGLPPRKRPTSLSGFFSKILPSNRPEQGGTTRIHDMTGETDSAYGDLGMNPNELTEWNLAQDRSPGPQPPGASTQSQHHKDQSWSMQRGRTRLRDDIGELAQAPHRTPSFEPARPPKPPELPGLQPPRHAHRERLRLTTREEIHNALRAKEDTRKHRRSLKESGDWLGVQGADPYSGEFAVLTPTSTLSSETTPPHIRKRLVELSRRQKFAKLAYDQAKCEEETEREKARLQKGQSKLEKIEGAKEELRQQQELPTWIQHKRRWSSAAEPDLSPIPQSLRSCRIKTNSDEVAAIPIRNFSRPSKSSGGSGAIDQLRPVDIFNNSENTEPSKNDHRRSPSTDTIVHKSLTNMDFPDTSIKTTKILYPSAFSDADDSPTKEQRTEKHFLWRRRRRVTDPGKLAKRSGSLMTHSSAGKTGESFVSDFSVEPPLPVPQLESRDHLSDQLIPDSHLHLMPYTGRMARMGNSLDPMKREPFLVTATRPALGSHSETRNNSALKVATNLLDCREPKINPTEGVLHDNGAIAISYQSRLKGSTKPTPIHPSIIPLLSSSAQARLVQPQASQIQKYGAGQTQNHVDIDLPGHTQGTRNLRQSITREGLRAAFLEDYISDHMTESHERDPRGFASTSTTTITGFGPELQPPLEETPSHMEPWKDRGGITIGNDESPTQPSPQIYERELSNASTTDEEWETTATPSRPTTLRRSSQSPVLAHETPVTDTASIDLATSETDSTPPAQHHKINEAVIPHHLRVNGDKSVRQRREPYEHREAMIQDAARIAIQRSLAKEAITTRSRTPSHTPSPERSSGGDGRKPNIRVINVGTLIEQDATRRRPRDITATTRGENTKPGHVVAFVSFVTLVGMITLGLVCAAWSVVKPVFDTRSQLWRRRRRGEKTWEDDSVIVVAGVFLVLAALVIAGVVRTTLWIACHL
ncbi:hypothetical protein F5B21DRAFT_525061 [Xylaria acuta]|nr:hypothetical protein F5B21DRAFT_525061 [Xylaria acuta]